MRNFVVKPEIKVNLNWKGNAGNYNQKVSSLPVNQKDYKIDFDLVVNAVTSLSNSKKQDFELLTIDVYDLYMFDKNGDYVTLSDKELIDVVNQVKNNLAWD